MILSWFHLSSSKPVFLCVQGMQCARGAVILFADADGATKFCDLAKLESSLKDVVKGNDKFGIPSALVIERPYTFSKCCNEDSILSREV
jgi:hypothetical protein